MVNSFNGEVPHMKVIIDRFEGKYAVCEREDGTMFNFDRSKLPLEASEGDIILIDGNNVSIDVKATKERNKYMKKLMDDVWE